MGGGGAQGASRRGMAGPRGYSVPRFGRWSRPSPTYLVCGRVVHQADAVNSLQEAEKKARRAWDRSGDASGLGGRCAGPARAQGDGAATGQQLPAFFLDTCLPSRSES